MTLRIAACGLPSSARQQRRGEPDRTQQVDGDGLLRRTDVTGGEVLDALDAGVVDHDVEVRIVVGQLGGESPDVGGVALIQRQVLDARVGLGDGLKRFAASARDDDLVAQSVQ